MSCKKILYRKINNNTNIVKNLYKVNSSHLKEMNLTELSKNENEIISTTYKILILAPYELDDKIPGTKTWWNQIEFAYIKKLIDFKFINKSQSIQIYYGYLKEFNKCLKIAIVPDIYSDKENYEFENIRNHGKSLFQEQEVVFLLDFACRCSPSFVSSNIPSNKD